MDVLSGQISPVLLGDLRKIIASVRLDSAQTVLIANREITRQSKSLFEDVPCDSFLPNESPAEDKCYDLGIAWCLNSELGRKRADHQIAGLRDRLCKRLYLYEVMGSAAAASELREHLQSLGLLWMKTYGDIAAFYFDIYDYKAVPEWLNSDFWANPEQWGKTRW